MNPHPNIKPPRLVEYLGETKSIRQWAKQFNINPRTLHTRLSKGMEFGEALNMPVKTLVRKPKEEPKVIIPIEHKDDARFGIRAKMLNCLMETFFEDKERFTTWVKKQMEDDYDMFFKKVVMPFLPKDPNALLDKGQEKAVISIEFKGAPAPSSIDIGGA